MCTFNFYINKRNRNIAKFRNVFKSKSNKTRYRLIFYHFNRFYKSSFFDLVRYNYKFNNRKVLSAFYRNVFFNNFNTPFFITFCPIKRSEVIEIKSYWSEKGFKSFVMTRFMSKLVFFGGEYNASFTGRLLFVQPFDIYHFFNYFFEYFYNVDSEFEIIKPRIIGVFNKIFEFEKFNNFFNIKKEIIKFFISGNVNNNLNFNIIYKVFFRFNTMFFTLFNYKFIQFFFFMIKINKNNS